MPRQLARDRLDPLDGAACKISRSEIALHLGADFFPARGADLGVDAAIGDDLDIAVGQQQVDQHAVVVSGVPDPQLREDIQRALPRGLIPKQRRAVQCAFHDKTDLARMRALTRPDRLLDRTQHLRRKNPPHPPAVLKKMPADAPDIHCLPAPRRAAAAKTATAAAEPAAVARTAARASTAGIGAAVTATRPAASPAAAPRRR